MYSPPPRRAPVGPALAQLRQRAGLTQAELAERLGLLSPETISRYERGEREPRVSSLIRIAEVLGVSPEELLGHPASADGEHPLLVAEPPAPPYASAEELGRLKAQVLAEVDEMDLHELPLLRALAAGLQARRTKG
jgi:transcriptional regulator with XRE-family HTH domain